MVINTAINVAGARKAPVLPSTRNVVAANLTGESRRQYERAQESRRRMVEAAAERDQAIAALAAANKANDDLRAEVARLNAALASANRDLEKARAKPKDAKGRDKARQEPTQDGPDSESVTA